MSVSDKEKIWLEVRNFLRKRLNEDIYNTWIRSITPVHYDGDKEFILGVPDNFFAEWLEIHYTSHIAEAFEKALSKNINFRFEAIQTQNEDSNDESEESSKGNSHNSNDNKKDLKTQEEFVEIPNCNSKYIFDSFIVGDGNSFAYSAAKAVSGYPGVSFNPLFIYGVTGLGKTHLIQALAHEARKINKNLKVEYVTCEEFVNLFIEAIQNRQIPSFRKRFRNIDMLLIDDVHFLAQKTQIQEEFFNTFNSLHNFNKQIVLTSDRSPSEIGGLESRLVSRFQNGLTTDIQPPSFETRMAILKKKQEEQSIKIDDEILSFIANRVKSNVRRLEGALIRLTAYSSMLAGTRIDLTVAEKLLHPILMEEEITKVTIDTIQKYVASHYDLRVNDLLGKKRPRNIAYPRMIAMYLSRHFTESSLPEIGDSFGGRTHATVISAINKIEKERKNDKKLDHSLSLIERQLQNN